MKEKLRNILVTIAGLGLVRVSVSAEGAPAFDTGDTAWMLVSTALVPCSCCRGWHCFMAAWCAQERPLHLHALVRGDGSGRRAVGGGRLLAGLRRRCGGGLIGDFSKVMLNGLVSFTDGTPRLYHLPERANEGGIPEYDVVRQMYAGACSP